DLANEMSLRRSADCGIARHVRDGVPRQRAQADAAPEPGGGVCRFNTRVARTDHDDVESHHYLPMQKRSKMWRSTSSLVRRPTISSRRMRADWRSIRRNSSGT